MRIEHASSYGFNFKLGLLLQAHRFLEDLKTEYPAFNSWYAQKVCAGVLFGSREILFSRDCESEELAAIAILKSDGNQKKICTLRVGEEYQNMGLGSALLDESIYVLQCERPLITVPEKRHDEFKPLLKSRGFRIIDVLPNYYTHGASEYCYNAYLEAPSTVSEAKRPIAARFELAYA